MYPLGRTLSPLGRGYGGAAAVTPDQISGLLRWYQADALALSNGASVTSWTDSSANAVPATTDVGLGVTFHTGVLNGKPVVRFDGASSLKMLLSLGTGASIFAVANPGAGAGYKRVINVENSLYLGTAASPANSFASFYGNGSAWGTVANWGAAALTSGTAYLLASINDGTTDHGYTNGASVGSRANAMTAFTNQSCALGAQLGGAQAWDGDMAEIILYSRALTGTERQNVEDYCRVKYALY